MDSDGDLDLFSASSGDGIIAWYENDGIQNFTSHTIFVETGGPVSVFAQDIDDDGDTDVLTAASDYGSWYKNNGNQNFTRVVAG